LLYLIYLIFSYFDCFIINHFRFLIYLMPPVILYDHLDDPLDVDK